MAAITAVCDLKPFKSMWKIRVKIIRLWKQYSAAGGLTIEMGVKINASVKKDLVNQFDSFLSEGSSKIFINFTVIPSGGSYRTTIHPYKIGFLSTTRVRCCDDLPIELTGFQPVNYMDILDGTLNTDYLVDVMGQIVEVTPLEVVSANGKETKKISIELRNEKDERLPMVLWGNLATDISEAIQRSSENVIVVVLRFGKIKVWKEERSVSNAYNVSEVEINPFGPEVEAFMSLLPRDELALSIVQPKPLLLTNGTGDKNDFFVNTPRKNIQQLIESNQVEQCIVMCTIAAIDSDMGWYYLSCKVCSKKVLHVPNEITEDGEDDDELGFHYYCVKCKVKNPKLLPRYKLHLVVLDNTGNAKFLLFDNLAVQLIHHPCNELVGPNAEEMQDPDLIPMELKNLAGKTYLFKVAIERDNFLYKNGTYRVLKIVTNIEMITEFENLRQPQAMGNTLCLEDSVISDAPEGSAMLSGGSSQDVETNLLTPAKRPAATVFNLEEHYDENSVTKNACSVRIKKEKTDKSG
ncbi:replication protein A 70 kDa DNA-binding subunit C-like [Raphanus sativus]|uniref:Replication protein A 70 kDa DNA-binding subunit C-like n=1 Tax=Raphanus sativus TaxID=3726 RepID=A0A9W3CK41_RAPSA|nr:replication protein A 70 kDa DNA-binding subunit C-like [Raphanus sativus]